MRESNHYAGTKSVAVIGNYVPRQCGIATFTADLVESLTSIAGQSRIWAMAMNDKASGYNYPEKVRFEINQNNVADYKTAAGFININNTDIVCLQHEYGIFGGPAGSHILKLLDELDIPVVTTLHTVLIEPENEYYKVMKRLAGLSDKLIVMSRHAVDILQTVYDIPKEKIAYIPHGIPDIPFVDPNYYKEQFDLLGKNLLLTFGLLSQNKGIEYVIQALPRVVQRFPGLVYVVLGATHPHVLKNEGEKYRQSLQKLVNKLGLNSNVVFENRFVSMEELCDYLAAADLYVTPYTNESQITSGTLAYAMGTGKAVISTPYWYAKEMLANGRGKLVPFKDSDSIADQINHFLENDSERHLARKHAYDFSREAIWAKVAVRYLEVFEEVREGRNRIPHPLSPVLRPDQDYLKRVKLPPIKLDHLIRMTDDTGMLQHSTYTVPNRDHGYCTDDNARALIVAVQVRDQPQKDPVLIDTLINRYLSFLMHAFNEETGRFRNFMNFSREWLEQIGSEDAHGRALWSLGTAVRLMENSAQLPLTSTLFTQALKAVEMFKSPRSIAFSMIGTHAYLKTFSGDSEARRIFSVMAERLYGQFSENASDEWPWLEEKVTYANGKLPHALLLAGHMLQRDDIFRMGLTSLKWLINIQTENGHLSPIGNHGWYKRGEEKARFDQQPIEANALLEACIAAYKTTGDHKWLDPAFICFNWFLGHNDLNLPLYNAKSGGCYDGLECDRINQNEGAESTLSWLLSLAPLHRLSALQDFQKPGRKTPARIAEMR